MQRRTFLIAGLGAVTLPRAAYAQAPAAAPTQIEAENELERAFLSAFRDPSARPGFRRELLASRVALALANSAADSPPRMQQVREDLRVGLIYSSASRLAGVLGPAAPRIVLTGRDALARLTGQHVAFNFRLVPMLTLEPEDVAEYLAS